MFVVAIAAAEGMEAAQDPAGTSELVHALELWQFTPEKSVIQWVKKKKTPILNEFFYEPKFHYATLLEFMRTGVNNMKMQNTPTLSSISPQTQ